MALFKSYNKNTMVIIIQIAHDDIDMLIKIVDSSRSRKIVNKFKIARHKIYLPKVLVIKI